MSPPGPIKSFPKRLYTVLPRARSNSLSSSSSRSLHIGSPPPLSSPRFFDSPPPPGKPNNGHSPLTPSRLPPHPLEAPNPPDSPTHSHSSHSSHSSNSGSGSGTNGGSGAPPSSLALTATSPSSHSSAPHHSLPPGTHNPPFFPYTPFSPPSATPSPPDPESELAAQAVRSGPHKHRAKYHFDVGAYGIPKRGARAGAGCSPLWSANNGSGSPAGSRIMDSLDLAVQVGEDAYFVRENAMGVADGVGGWSRCKSPHMGPTDPSPSALFARRLMHFCSAEIASSTAPSSSASSRTSSTPPSPPTTFTFHPSSSYVPFQPPAAPVPHPAFLDSVAEEAEECEDSDYDDLEEGLDILLILERAYERALQAHVVPSPSPPPSTARTPSPTHTASSASPSPEPVPLLTGSSTALLAVLDHAGPAPPPSPFAPPAAAPAPTPVPSLAADSRIADCDAVIRIAHLGDCMGMLVRDDEIVWRSDEMWWAFNTPLQLGPSTRTPPSSAQILTVPVRADDILILASDGLSDNLWDEDVLDEVARFRRGFLGASRAPSPASADAWAPSGGLLGRRTLAGMLSEALCSRARRVAEGRGRRDDEVPFARRAREEGRSFRGGKADDISVLVAVISPAESAPPAS